MPNSELEWLIANSREQVLESGESFFKEGQSTQHFYVVLEGELVISRTIDGQEKVLGTTPRGIIGGELALLSVTVSLITSRAIMPLPVDGVSASKASAKFFAACPVFAAYIFKIAAERTNIQATVVNQAGTDGRVG